MRLGKKEEANKKLLYSKPIDIKAKQEFYGKVPNLLIGTHNYPTVNVGSLITENFSDQDNVHGFVKNNTKIPDIVSQRQSLINTKMKMYVKEKDTRYGRQVQELAKSIKATTSEAKTENQ